LVWAAADVGVISLFTDFHKKAIILLHKLKYGGVMNSKQILENALNLKPQDKIVIIEGLLNSLDEPDKTIDEIWAKEAEKRLKAYREGKLKGIDFSEIFE
jgi:putative addiction module component (TIGR02574 family)